MVYIIIRSAIKRIYHKLFINPERFISKMMSPNCTHRTVSPRAHDTFSCWLRSDFNVPQWSSDTKGKDHPYLPEMVWRDHHGQHNSSAYEDPQKIRCPLPRSEHLFWTDTVLWKAMANHTTQPRKQTIRCLSPAFLRRQNTHVYKSPKNIHTSLLYRLLFKAH